MRPFRPAKVALAAVLPLRTTDKLYFRNLEVSILDVGDDKCRYQGVLIALEITVGG